MNGSTARRAAALVLLTLVLDPPITDWPRFVAWMAGFLAVFAAPPPKSWRRIGLAALVSLIALIGRHALPALHIEEAHNYFLPGPADAVRDWLPPPVLSALEEQFRERYPAEYWCDPRAGGCWQASVPLSASFAFSADAFLDERRYSRVVSAVDFRGLGALRAGFTNRVETNWWDRTSDVRRRQMPFYVMYVLPREAAGTVLCWRGDVFWEHPGGFQDLGSRTESCRAVQASDAGNRVFGISVMHQPLSMRLDLTPSLARAAAARQAVAVLGAAAAVLVSLWPLRRRVLLSCALAAVGALAMGPEALASFGRYDPIGGGSDGIPFESYAHTILERVEAGDLAGALKGVEASFFFMPGLRYFRAVEKALFGDTYLGYLAALLAIPAMLLKLLRLLLPALPALALWVAFFLPLPHADLFWWSFQSYVELARGGLAEPLAQALWLGGAGLLMSGALEPTGAGRHPAWGSLALSLACVVRPNFLIASGLVLLFVSYRLGRTARWREVRTVWLAFTPFLWLPLHNYVYAGRLELVSRPVGPEMLTPPTVYVQALRDVLGGPGGGPEAQRIVTQLAGWIGSPIRAVALALSVVGLLLRGVPLAHRALVLGVVGLHPLLLFWVPQGRYSHLAWQITLVSAAANAAFLGALAARRARPLLRHAFEFDRGRFTRRRVGAVVAGVALVVVILEAAFRVARSDRETPDVVVACERAHFFTRPNSLGFRGPELHRRPDCLGLVTLGGGTTESARLADVESWPGRLQSELSGAFRCVQVTNAGREGFSTFGVGRLLDGLVLAAKPDGILLMTGHDDVARERATLAERAPLWPRRLRHVLGRHSALGSAVLSRPAERRYAVPTRMPAELVALPGASVDRREAQVALVRHRQTYVPAYRERLEEIVVRARERGVEPILLTQPALYGDAVDPATQVDLRSVRVDAAGGIHGGLAWRILELYNDAARDLGREHRVQVVDLARRLPKDSRLYADFVNLSRDGAARAAEIVASGVCPSLALRFPGQVADRCPVGPGT